MVAGSNNGRGSKVMIMDQEDEDQRFHESGVSTRPAERENDIGECVFRFRC